MPFKIQLAYKPLPHILRFQIVKHVIKNLVSSMPFKFNLLTTTTRLRELGAAAANSVGEGTLRQMLGAAAAGAGSTAASRTGGEDVQIYTHTHTHYTHITHTLHTHTHMYRYTHTHTHTHITLHYTTFQ